MGNDTSTQGQRQQNAKRVANRPPPKVQNTQSASGAKINNAIQNIDAAIDKLDKKEVYLEKQIKKMNEFAKKKMDAGDKRGALMLLKKRKMYEKQQLQISNTKMNLEMQKMSLDDTATNQVVTSAMISGAKVQKEVVKEHHMDKIDKLKEDIQEGMDMQEQMNDMLGENIMGENPMSDDELLNELDGLMAEDTLEELDLPETNDMKTTTVKPSREQREADELAMLNELNGPAPAKRAARPAAGGRAASSKEEAEMRELEAMLA